MMTKTDTEKHKKQDLLAACLLSFLLTAGLLAVLYAVSGFAPFGDSAVPVMDLVCCMVG